MRDVGILVWVGLLIVGVVGSMVSSLRKQAQTRPVPARLPDWALQLGAAPSASERPPPAAAPPPSAAPGVRASAKPPQRPAPPRHEPAHLFTERAKASNRLFGDKRAIVRAVIAAEVLGKPRAFSDEYFGR